MLLSEHHEALEYDLLTICNVDLLDLYRGTLTPRRLWVLARHLPPDSQVKRVLDPEGALRESWRTTDYLLAVLVDRFSQVNFKNPTPVPRPDDLIAEEQKRRPRMAVFEAHDRRLRAAKEVSP